MRIAHGARILYTVKQQPGLSYFAGAAGALEALSVGTPSSLAWYSTIFFSVS